MTSQPGKQTIAIHILSNISRSKGSQTINFEQLIEYNIRTIFHEKPYIKCGGEAFPRPLSKKSKLSISVDQQPEFLFTVLFLQVDECQNILKLRS